MKSHIGDGGSERGIVYHRKFIEMTIDGWKQFHLGIVSNIANTHSLAVTPKRMDLLSIAIVIARVGNRTEA